MSEGAKWAQEHLAAGADMEGAMIALWVPEDVGEKIKQPGGEPVENMHITLCYFQDPAAVRDDWDEIKELVRSLSKPFRGRIGGWGNFWAPDEGFVAWAAVDIPGLEQAQVDLAHLCAGAGFPVNSEHGWTPHITLRYGDFFAEKDVPFEGPIDVEFPGLVFARGEEKEELWQS